MSTIRVSNFGPIKAGLTTNNGWIDIAKVTVFIGNQGSGKSTIAKLISTFTWIEKSLVRGDHPVDWFEKKGRLESRFLTYHRLENYFHEGDGDKTEIEYQGNAYHFHYLDREFRIRELPNSEYQLPQIMYVPAERNFITYFQSTKELRLSSEPIQEFLDEFNKGKKNLTNQVALPINSTTVEYDKSKSSVFVKGSGFKVDLSEASSGFQSLVPLFLVSRHLANSVLKQSKTKEPMTADERSRFGKRVEAIWSDDNLTDEQKRISVSAIASKFNKSAFINIVEEPEQNLFPSSQWQLLKSLLQLNNLNAGNKLIQTTHSPFVINYLSSVIKAGKLRKKVLNNHVLSEKLGALVPFESMVDEKDLKIYEMNERSGSINLLGNYNGLPSDENYLNNGLADTNDLFSNLLDIEDECR